MAFANNPNYDSWLSVTNSFFKKFSNLILGSRIRNEKESGKKNIEVLKIGIIHHYIFTLFFAFFSFILKNRFLI
jgi:hypothetical protein